MAELYLAKDTKKDRLVVIKRILPYLAQEREFVQMFLDEARIASQLHHPNIITVYELGHLEGSIFIAMEYVEGVDLRKIFNEEQKRQGTVPPNISAWLTSRLCEGLHYAHNRTGADGKPLQIIHRDVSPQNLMVGYQGQVKLVDFGIAKAGAFMERSKPGVIKGKFLYLSPEQLSQERIDHRADIFALGTMMYEISTGKSPFYKATTEAVIYAIRAEEPPPPHLTRRDYPLGLSRIITRCLAKDRNKRYQQAGDVHNDLEAWMRAEARTSIDDVKRYVARLFGGDDERTSLFIPANARGPSDRSSPGISRLPPTDPERTARGAAASAPRPSAPSRTVTGDETTRPITAAVPLTEGSSAPSGITNSSSIVTAPVGRRPTPQPMKPVSGTRQALQPPPRASNPAMQAYASGQSEPRTQTARPQDLAKAFTAPPVRKPSGEALRPAGGDDEDATSLSGSGRLMTGDSLPSPAPAVKTPSTAEARPVARRNEPARAPMPAAAGRGAPTSQGGARVAPPVPSPVPAPGPARKPTRVENGAVRAPTGAVPQAQARRPTRAESGAVLEVPSQFARDEIGGPPVPMLAPTLPPEPPTRGDRPAKQGRTPSSEDLGPLLDDAIPSGLNHKPLATIDQDDEMNTQDLRGLRLSQLGESQDGSAELPSQQLEAPVDDDDEPGSAFAERPWLVAALVFVVVLVLGLGGLAIFRARGKKDVPLPPKPDDVAKVEKDKGEPLKPEPAKVEPKGADPVQPPPQPPPSTEVETTETVMVTISAPPGTRLVDMRDSAALQPNTEYRWHPGRRPIQYRCPKKGRLTTPDVTFNVEVKPGVATQEFKISCK